MSFAETESEWGPGMLGLDKKNDGHISHSNVCTRSARSRRDERSVMRSSICAGDSVGRSIFWYNVARTAEQNFRDVVAIDAAELRVKHDRIITKISLGIRENKAGAGTCPNRTSDERLPILPFVLVLRERKRLGELIARNRS